MVNNKISLKLLDREAITPRAFKLTFSLTEPESFEFVPGQFISILVPSNDGKVLRRSYSLINKPGSNLEIIYTHFPNGVASEYFRSLEIGDLVNAMGPLGRFVINGPIQGRYIFVATGTGIGPFISMMKSHDFSRADLKVVFGCRTVNDSICKNIEHDFSLNLDKYSITSCYSREESDINTINGFQGYVQDKLKTMDLDPSSDKFYLCGHPKMVEDVSNYLLGIKIPQSQIIKEKYVVAGLKN